MHGFQQNPRGNEDCCTGFLFRSVYLPSYTLSRREIQIPLHHDDEQQIVEGSTIFTVSVGSDRYLTLQNQVGLLNEASVEIKHGSVYSMSRESQSTWKHRDNDQCQGALETLEHIFIQYSHTNTFKNRLKTFINNKIDREYRDNGNYHFMICNHANPLVNYINLAAKWYISRNFQHSKPLIWDEFVRYIKFALNGDKKNICVILEEALKS